MPDNSPNVLVVDDDAHIRKVMVYALQRDNLHILSASSGWEGLELARPGYVDLILLDLHLPDMEGFDFIQRLRQTPGGAEIPIILLTGQNTPEIRDQGFKLGIEDFIAKPFDLNDLRSRVSARLRSKRNIEALVTQSSEEHRKVKDEIREVKDRFSALAENSFDLIGETDHTGRYLFLSPNHEEILGYKPGDLLEQSFFDYVDSQDRGDVTEKFRRSLSTMESDSGIFRFQHQNGEWRWLETTAKPFLTAAGDIHFVLVSRDITQRIANERRLAFLATHDSLTSLWNRSHFTQALRRVIEESKEGMTHALLYLDLDNFKIINDTVGHAAGDRMLLAIAELLRNHIQNQGHIARFGGDEFVVLFEHMPFDQVHAICKTLCQIIDDFRFGESGQVFDVTASLGLVYIDYQVTSEEVLARADSACYDAKKKGKNRLVVYQPQDSELKQLVDDSNWASRIRQALRQQQFEVWLQPIRNIKTREAEHYEALVRLRDPSGTYITPASFIPPAERFGIMPSLDRHILAQTVQLMNRHRDLKLSINLSGTSLVDSDLPDYIDEIFSKHHVQPRRVMFEITETAYITNMLKAQELLSYLRDQGFRFALDDFGCGFSSLAYLRNLNVDYIKIDGSFVRNLEHDRLNQTLIKSINEVAHLLQKKTVAEFVEDEASLKILEQIGVDYVQGNYLGQPAPYPG